MSYINPITCENAWLSFEDILRLIIEGGYIKTYGDLGNLHITADTTIITADTTVITADNA